MAQPLTLDTGLSQVLVDFFNDENYHWHHRLLLVQLEKARWVVATPDLQVEVTDLAEHRVMPLGRKQAFPDRVRGNAYIFDELDPGVEEDLINQAVALAKVMGISVTATQAQPGRVWRVADPAREDFDEAVPNQDMVGTERCVVRGDLGLYLKATVDGDVWVVVERVLDVSHDDWLDMKRSGPGRDLRVAACEKDGTGARFIALKDAVSKYRPRDFADWPFQGPRAAQELLPSILKSGMELAQYHGFWAGKSGINQAGSVAFTHKNAFQTLALMQTYDQFDLYNSAAAEFISRWILMTQAAVRKNPRAPDFSGLDHYLAHGYDETGGALTSQFAKYIADEKRNDAMILKQNRLWAEEQEADAKKRVNKDSQKGNKGGGRGGAGAAEA